LQQHQQQQDASIEEEEEDPEQPTHSRPQRAHEEWMLICQRAVDIQPDTSSEEDFDLTAAAQSYPNLEEAPTFVSRNRHQAEPHTFTTSASAENLQGCQLEVYTTVKDHFESENSPPLRMIVTGTAGTGKSYVIQCIRLLLGDSL
jgi:ATP-dependent DNA helicase PIF1